MRESTIGGTGMWTIGINEDIWRTLRAARGLTTSDDVAEHLGLDPAHVDAVLRGHESPSGPFVAESLLRFPESFSGLFEVVAA